MKTYAIVRILGNDLPPRHKPGQTLSNLKFTLENESDFEECKKLWIVNRIVDLDEEAKIIELLKTYHQDYIHLPFETDNYNHQWPISKKLWYIIKLNQARNIAIREGKKYGKWVFPLDGNIFIDDAGWESIIFYLQNLNNKLFKLWMYRIKEDNQEVFQFAKENYDKQEPQIVLHFENNNTFVEQLEYGNGNKEEFLFRFPNAPCLEYVIRLNDQTKGYINQNRWNSRDESIPLLIKRVENKQNNLTREYIL
jgi:hypothetical protein